MSTTLTFPATDATVHRLDNGLEVILRPDHSAPLVSVQAWVRTGSLFEADLLGTGVSHLVEHMVFKGAGGRGPVGIRRRTAPGSRTVHPPRRVFRRRHDGCCRLWPAWGGSFREEGTGFSLPLRFPGRRPDRPGPVLAGLPLLSLRREEVLKFPILGIFSGRISNHWNFMVLRRFRGLNFCPGLWSNCRNPSL